MPDDTQPLPPSAQGEPDPQHRPQASRRQRLVGAWGEAVGTRGGRLATGVAVTLVALLLLGGLAAGAFALGAQWGERGRGPVAGARGGGGPEHGRDGGRGGDKRDRADKGDKDDRTDKGDKGGKDDRAHQDGRNERGGEPGGPGPLAPGLLSDLLHGEFTTTGGDGSRVVMTVQVGQVTAASATSVAVRSSDGFSGSYRVEAQTRVPGGGAARLRAGDEVVVVARKETSTAVLVHPAPPARDRLGR